MTKSNGWQENSFKIYSSLKTLYLPPSQRPGRYNFHSGLQGDPELIKAEKILRGGIIQKYHKGINTQGFLER